MNPIIGVPLIFSLILVYELYESPDALLGLITSLGVFMAVLI